jgi:hypothetical protein
MEGPEGYLFAELNGSQILVSSVRLFRSLGDAEHYIQNDFQQRASMRRHMQPMGYWYRRRLWEVRIGQELKLVPLKQRLEMV